MVCIQAELVKYVLFARRNRHSMIKTYNINDPAWNSIVKSFKDYDVYYLCGYVKAFRINGDGEPVLIYFQTKDGSTRAINVVMKRDISKSAYFSDKIQPESLYDITTPYGYGGFIIEGNDISQLTSEYEIFCKKNNIVCEFVRFHPILRNWERLDGFYKDTHLGDTVCIDTSNVDVIWGNFSTQNRNKIRKAKKNELKVFWGRYPEIIDSFMEIYNETMDKDDADSYYYFKKDFYESILYDLEQEAMWFYAVKDGIIAAISIFLFCNGNMHYHLSASRREFQYMAPTNLLLYEAALWACAHGYTKLHLGGGLGSLHDSLYTFKKNFNRKEDMEFHVGTRVFMQDDYDTLFRQRVQTDPNFDSDTNYFPKYRAKNTR